MARHSFAHTLILATFSSASLLNVHHWHPAPNRLIHPRALPSVDSLFPHTQGVSSWTTFPGSPNALPLDAPTLNPENTLEELGPFFEVGPDDKLAIRIHYRKGSFKLSGNPPGGLFFHSAGPGVDRMTGDADLSNARDATFAYSVYFPVDFEFAKGGKLPGLYGGNSGREGEGCSGGHKDTTDCFSSRLMWREDGAGEVYVYLPSASEPGFESNQALCETTENFCDPTYGISLGPGRFSFPRGEWTTVSQRLRLNDPGKANGIIELWVNGNPAISSENIVIRDSTGTGRIDGLMVQSFFGGNSSDWACPKDQDIWISDFSVAIIEAGVDAVVEPTPSPQPGNGIDEESSSQTSSFPVNSNILLSLVSSLIVLTVFSV